MRRLALLCLFCAGAVAHADPSGKKWFTTPVQYRVFAHSQINGVGNFQGSVLPEINAGFARWANAVCTGGTTRWAATNAGNFTSPSGLSAITNDGTNRVIWLGGSSWQHGAQTLGLTITTYYTTTGQIIDGDMQLNNDRTWKLGGSAGNQVDVQSIITHEAGHFLGLDHSAPTSAVMFANYNIGAGEIKRTLTSTDINDVCAVYPPTTPGGSGVQGDPCTSNSQCASNVCRGAPGGQGLVCTTPCTSNAQCPAGYTCQSATPSGMACLPPIGAVDLCKFCSDGTQCSTGNCVTTGQINWCTRTCMQASDCGPGYDCVQGSTSNVCAPSGGQCPAPQCTSASQCAVGYACQGGMCVATGNVGDRCEISVFCQSCASCILEANGQEALCRACCGGGAGNGMCEGCNNSTCPSGNTCYGVTNSTDQVCAATQAANPCGACDAQTPCSDGYTCFNGRCHSSCNPQSPGGCQACFATGTGGICACPGEVAHTGQSCGQTPLGLRICTTGNACVGTPAICRARCDVANPASCPSGQACESVGGEAVCVPTNTPGQRCASCDANLQCDPGYQCVNGRCYEPCQPGAGSSCTSCVTVTNNFSVCACDDQLAGQGQGCGAIAGEVFACAQGLTCVNSICRLQCSADAHCPDGYVCGSGHCSPWQTPEQPNDAGTNVPVTPKPDAGAGGGSNDLGCGCSAGAGAVGGWLALGLLGMATRRRRRA